MASIRRRPPIDAGANLSGPLIEAELWFLTRPTSAEPRSSNSVRADKTNKAGDTFAKRPLAQLLIAYRLSIARLRPPKGFQIIPKSPEDSRKLQNVWEGFQRLRKFLEPFPRVTKALEGSQRNPKANEGSQGFLQAPKGFWRPSRATKSLDIHDQKLNSTLYSTTQSFNGLKSL